MKKLILTALDDNHKLYYECFVPFILSLKQTDFDGDIGVISYNLSSSKEDVLRLQGIKVFPASHRYSEILMDRHISAADIAERHGYDQVAVYDADIWFPEPNLTIFETLENRTALYCSYDIYRCTFLTNCIQSENVPEINRLLDQVVNANGGYVWQVGIMVGHKEAWKKYRDYVITQLTDPQFILTYGIDSTILNLYSLEAKGNVEHLPERYNCVPVWGIMVGFDSASNKHRHYLNGKVVEGIHVTRAHRESGEFSYLKWHADTYYQQAKNYRDKDYPYYNITKESLVTPTDRQYHNPPIHVELVSAQANVMTVRLEGDHTCFEVQGDSNICIKNPADKATKLFFHWRSVMNYEPMKNVYILINGNKIGIKFHSNTYVTLAPNETISFVTEEPDVESKRICWCVESVKIS